MITPLSDTKLSILHPGTNRAFAEAIKNATPAQLDQLKEGKDLKSLITSVFQDKITSDKSDQILLSILKNGAAFKNMGNFSQDIKSLLSEMKNSPDLSLKPSILEGFAKNIALLNSDSLKGQIANSGIFMESKIGIAAQILPTLKDTLIALQDLLSKSNISEVKTLNAALDSLIKTPVLNQFSVDMKNADQLAEGVKKITDTLQGIISKSDILYSKEIARFVQKLDQFVSIIPDPSSLAEVKTALSQLYGILLSSKAESSNALLDSIELLLKNLGNNAPDSFAKLGELSLQLRNAIASGDIVVSDDVSKLIAKLNEFTHPKALLIDTILEESMSNDLKSGLMKLAEELQNTSNPKAEELLKNVDKLLTVIDYHQLISHLSGSNSIYIPFAWDQLEEGSLSFKKTKDKKFYCEINLRLKEYGELDLMMGLYDGNQIEIQIHAEKPELKNLIQQHIGELRSVLIEAGLTLRGIRIFEKKENLNTPLASYSDLNDNPDMGFEVKV